MKGRHTRGNKVAEKTVICVISSFPSEKCQIDVSADCHWFVSRAELCSTTMGHGFIRRLHASRSRAEPENNTILLFFSFLFFFANQHVNRTTK